MLTGRAFAEGVLAELPLPPDFGTESRAARLLQLYRTLNDDTYPHWAGQAFAAHTLEHIEENLDFLRLSMTEEQLMEKYFDREKLARLHEIGSPGKPIPRRGGRWDKRPKENDEIAAKL